MLLPSALEAQLLPSKRSRQASPAGRSQEGPGSLLSGLEMERLSMDLATPRVHTAVPPFLARVTEHISPPRCLGQEPMSPYRSPKRI